MLLGGSTTVGPSVKVDTTQGRLLMSKLHISINNKRRARLCREMRLTNLFVDIEKDLGQCGNGVCQSTKPFKWLMLNTSPRKVFGDLALKKQIIEDVGGQQAKEQEVIHDQEDTAHNGKGELGNSRKS